MYYEIARYIKTKGWKDSPESNTFCEGKKIINNTCICVSGCVGNCSTGEQLSAKETFLNVIVNHDIESREIHSITFGVLAGKDFENRRDCFRVDFDKKGWHIDAEGYKPHMKINADLEAEDPNEYTKIIDLIVAYGQGLPRMNDTGLQLVY